MAPRAANVGSALAGSPVAAAPREQHQPGADAPGSAPARAGAAGEEEDDENVDVDTVEEMYGAAMREIERPGTSRISGAATSAAHNLPAALPAHSVPPIPEDTVASAQQTQPNSSVSGASSPRAPPSLGGGRALTSSSGVARGGGLAAAHATSAAVPPQEESDASSWFEFGWGGNLGLELIGTGTARAVQHVQAPQVSVVHVSARGQGQAEEGYEEREEVDDDERGRDVGVALTRDSVDDEVEFDDDDEVEDQAAEEAAAKAVRDQRRNRRLGWAHFTPEEVQSFLPPPGLTPEAAEAPSDSSPPSLPAPSAPVAPAPVAAPIVPSLGSPSASADSQDFLAAPHPRVPPANHEFGVDPYGIEFGSHVDPIRELTPGAQVSEPVPCHPDTGRAALSADQVPQAPSSVGRSGLGLPRFHTSGNFLGSAALSGRTDRGRPSSLPDVDKSKEEEKGGKGKGGKGKKDVRGKIRGYLPFMGRKDGKGKRKEGEDDEDGGGGLV